MLLSTFVSMEWKTRFPVGLFLLAALMLAGGVSAATSMRVAAAHHKATVVLASQSESETEPGDAEESDPEESDPTEESEPAEGDDQGHGGSVDRFHEGCALPEGVAALAGNWTHGDYVSAFAKGDDREAHLAAAHSSCGKPMKAVEKDKDKKDKDKSSKSKAHGKAAKHGRSSKHNA